MSFLWVTGRLYYGYIMYFRNENNIIKNSQRDRLDIIIEHDDETIVIQKK